MNVHFFEPPPAQRIGGLDAAIRSLEGALRAAGTVVDNLLPEQSGTGVAHFHGIWQPAHARLSRICRARGIPYVVSPHGMLEPWAWRHRWWKKWPYFQLIESRHLRGAACLLATAPAEAARIRAMLPGKRVATLPLGLTGSAQPDYLNARQQLGWEPDEQVLLFLSRIHVKKGLDLLFRALASVALPNGTRLVIVGGGDARYVGSVHTLATELSARLPRVDWIGEVWGGARWPYFQGADLFCLPSHSENFGLAVLEACSVGTPALTTTATPWADTLAGQPAYICDPIVSSVADALADFFNHGRADSNQRTTLASWTQEHFAWQKLSAGYLRLYQSLPLAESTCAGSPVEH